MIDRNENICKEIRESAKYVQFKKWIDLTGPMILYFEQERKRKRGRWEKE